MRIHDGRIRGPCRVEWMPHGKWRLIEPIFFEFYVDDTYHSFIAEGGFVHDFASIPRLFQNLYSPTGPWARDAVGHDKMYRERMFPRVICDKAFREFMRFDKVDECDREIIYLAVRLGGAHAYASGGAACGGSSLVS